MGAVGKLVERTVIGLPAPDSPHISVPLPRDSSAQGEGPASASLDRKCAPAQAPATDIANYFQLSFGQSHELRRQRGCEEDAKAVLRTRLAAMDAAKKKRMGGRSRDMDTSMSVLGARPRTMVETMDEGSALGGNSENCPGQGFSGGRIPWPRRGALEIAASVDLKVAKRHARWRNPELTPQVEARRGLRKEWMAKCDYGLRMNATEFWAKKCRRGKRSSMPE